MIGLKRGAEPAELAAIRTSELTRIRAVAALRTPVGDDIGDKYRFTRDLLHDAQHGKCCYCEWVEQKAGNPVEHVRPKAKADRSPGSASTEGYWWLSWTWENLVFACETCNSAGYKGIKFPLAVGSAVLAPWEPPPGAEMALLVDPYSEEPAESIEFVFAAGQWLPRPRRGRPDAKGLATIRVLGLAQRQELRTNWQSHVDHHVKPFIDRIAEATLTGQTAAVQAEWQRAMQHLFADRIQFHALSRDVLADSFPASSRRMWEISFPPALEPPL